MTIPGFGRVTPIQAAMLELAGYNLDPLKYGFDPARLAVKEIPDEEREAIIRQGLSLLQETIGQDFGFDLSAWHECLKTRPELEYRHPYGYQSTRRFIEAAVREAERERLVDGMSR